MDDRNIIVIERNIYTNETKYLWKNDVTNTMSDLSEKINSPFSRTKSDYRKFITGSFAEIAQEVVRTIDGTYNRQGMGLHIEVNGVEEDYLAIRETIEKNFPDRHMDCTWSGHMQTAMEVAQKVKEIYGNLKEAVYKYGETIELNNVNDEKGWLRFGFNREKIVSELALRNLCAGAGFYLEKVTAQIDEEADRNAEEILGLESQLQKADGSPGSGAEIDIDKLRKTMTRICRRYTGEVGREFETLLKKVEEKCLDENRIARLVRNAEDYAATHQIEWRKSSSWDDPVAQSLDEERRRNCILKMLVDDLNRDIRQYADEINSVGIQFGNQKIEELKTNILKEIYYSKEFTGEQKKTVRQRFLGDGYITASYHTLKAEEQVGEEKFRWTKRNFEEKDLCREYEKKLRKELKDKRNEALNGNSKVFEKWGDAFFEIWKRQDSNVQPDALPSYKEQIKEKLEFCQERGRKLTSLQDRFQAGRKQIEELLSFSKG